MEVPWRSHSFQRSHLGGRNASSIIEPSAIETQPCNHRSGSLRSRAEIAPNQRLINDAWFSRTLGETAPVRGGGAGESPGKPGVRTLADRLRSPRVQENLTPDCLECVTHDDRGSINDRAGAMTPRFVSSLGLMLLIGGCGLNGQDKNVVSVDAHDARMNAAMVEARSTVQKFIEALNNPGPGVSGLAVKVPVQTGSGTEHIWVKSVSYDGERFQGVVNNQPAGASSIKLGDKLTALPDGISDWMYLRGRKLVGGYTIRAVRDSLSAKEREAFDKSAPFVFEAAEGSAVRAPAELVGTWDLVSVDRGDGPTTRPGVRMEITEESIGMQAPSGAKKSMGEIAGAYPTTIPKGIDLSNGGKIGRGIYERRRGRVEADRE